MPRLIDKIMWLQAAGRIHTDFEKGFIMAEVMKFAAFKVGVNNSANFIFFILVCSGTDFHLSSRSMALKQQ